jgi:hypothetical protein
MGHDLLCEVVEGFQFCGGFAVWLDLRRGFPLGCGFSIAGTLGKVNRARLNSAKLKGYAFELVGLPIPCWVQVVV